MSDITVGDLKRQLAGWPDDTELEFQGGMTFYRLKTRGKNMVQLEFNEPQAYLTEEFRQREPEVFVAFFRPEDNGELVQEVAVPTL
ncbi:hypothetical protein [Brevundimonas sp.]|uniref:hypothetical protein n=1 Tax=Brevundimonas sp. TaxID=1871086 RepID=UPI002639D412|nr:hypothetical protein [Brevundimonas sp.]